ncbi:hypothetical protein [Pedobacter sp. SYSU D00535]|uniref:hypothetical protein n=1 Tax=Pedobacter sp. SYSU D00535 TaxID=2810308 RepID=UPI001A956FAD|nr:hypothetical protein [Pedobacter sp. SYSU D00535]
MKRILFFLVVLAACFTQVSAQVTDYLVTVKGDTLSGEIKRISTTKIKFMTDSGWVKFSSTDIRLYYDRKKDERYLSVLMPVLDPAFVDPRFKQVLEMGKINLVMEEYTTSGSVMTAMGITNSWHYKRNLYLQKGDDRAWKFDRKWIGMRDNGTEASRKKFEELIADNPELLRKFQEEKKISFEELRAYVIRYNSM